MKNILPVALALMGAAYLTSCSKEQTFVAPLPLGTEYYPLAVGNVRTYAVTDSTWTMRVPSAVSYQFRETVTGTYTDAAGQPAFRIVRAKRLSAGGNWADDSVFSVRANSQTVVLTRNNRPTVELIFPVRDGRLWNFSAFSNSTNDTISEETRRYRDVGQAFATAPVTTLGTQVPAKTYEQSLTTTDEGTALEDNLYYLRAYRQVYAKGVGPVFRERRRKFFSDGPSTPVPGETYSGNTRTETLIDFQP